MLGVRPEHFALGEGENAVPLHLTIVEQLGADTLVHGTLEGTSAQLVQRLEGIKSLNTGGAIRLHIPRDALHILDKETGQRVG